MALITSRERTDWPETFWSEIETRPLVIPVEALDWPGLKDAIANVVSDVMEHFPGCHAKDCVITTVQPGAYVAPHVDMHSPEWRTRIHVPLISNPQADFMVNDTMYNLKPGQAYKVNTEVMHSIRNGGTTNRIHLMFDVYE